MREINGAWVTLIFNCFVILFTQPIGFTAGDFLIKICQLSVCSGPRNQYVRRSSYRAAFLHFRLLRLGFELTNKVRANAGIRRAVERRFAIANRPSIR